MPHLRTNDESVGRDILSDDSSSANDSPIANRNAFQDDASESQPAIATDYYRTGSYVEMTLFRKSKQFPKMIFPLFPIQRMGSIIKYLNIMGD